MQVVVSFPGVHRRGGVERVAFECVNYLARAGHRVHVLASDWEPFTAPDVTCHRVDMGAQPFHLKGRAYFERATARLKEVPHDVLNTHGCICPGGGVQWVQSVHQAWLERSRQLRPPWSVARLKQRLNPLHKHILELERWHFAERNYRHLIVTTRQVQLDLARLYQVPAEDVTIVPNGFNPVEFSPTVRHSRRAASRAALGLQPEHRLLLFVGNELERKGYPVVLRALQALKQPDLKLLVVGRQVERAARQQARDLGVADQVIVHGSTPDVAGMHAAADLFVLPTQYEAFSLAILESLGSGLPVLTADVPGAQDAIQPGLNGALVADPRDDGELADRLRDLLQGDALERLSATTAATVERYQWPNVLKDYEQVLANTLVGVS